MLLVVPHSGVALRSQATVPEYNLLQCSGSVQDVAKFIKQLWKLGEGHHHMVNQQVQQ